MLQFGRIIKTYFFNIINDEWNKSKKKERERGRGVVKKTEAVSYELFFSTGKIKTQINMKIRFSILRIK